MSSEVQLQNKSTPTASRGSSPAKITSLSTLRALQKAAKQVRSESTDFDQPQSNIIHADSSNNVTFENKSSPKTKTKTPEDLKNQELRNNFQKTLSKLYRSDTIDLAMGELKTMIATNANPNSLRVFLSSLTEYKKIPTPMAQECEVALFGYLSTQFKENMIDPLDKSPGLIKTCFKVLECIISYFKVPANNVSKACSFSINQIYLNSLARETAENKCLLLYEPMEIILSGGTDRMSQNTASLCLCDLMLSIVQVKDSEFLEEIRKKFIPTFLKVNYEVPDIIRAMGILLDNTDIRLSGGKINNILDKLMKFAQLKTQIYQVLHVFLSHFKTKVESAISINIIGIKLLPVAESFIGNLHEEVIEVLITLSKDRLIKVQNPANEALRTWRKFQEELGRIENKKQKRDLIEFNADELIKLRTGIDINQPPEENLAKLAENIQALTNQKFDTVDHNIGSQNTYVMDRYRKNLKKKSGTGGGFVVLDKDRTPSPGNNATEHRRKEKIRDLVNKANDQKDKPEKFEGQVRVPGAQYIGRDPVYEPPLDEEDEDGRDTPHLGEPSHSQPLMTVKTNYHGEQSPAPQNYQDFAKEYNSLIEEKMYEAARRAISDMKKERHREMTNQLMDLQSQGFIKEIPKQEAPLKISDGPNQFHERNFDPMQNSSMKNRDNLRPESAALTRSNIRAPYANEDMGLGSDDMGYVTNAWSETLDIAPTRPISQHSRLKSPDSAFKSGPKDFIIRHNAKPVSTNPSVVSKELSQAPKRDENNTREAFFKEMNNVMADDDVEDTIPYDDLDEWLEHKKAEQHVAKKNHKEKESEKGRPKSADHQEGTLKSWTKALEHLEEGDHQAAYETILNSGDDVFLLRLMSKTGPCLENLHRKTAISVTNRITQIMSSNFLESMFTEFVREGINLDLVDQLPVGDQNELLEQLYHISSKESSLGKSAAELYSVMLAKTNT